MSKHRGSNIIVVIMWLLCRTNHIIFGHTDTKGTIKYNINLSIKRAEAVKEILLSLGITAKNVSVLGKGENQLAVDTPDNTKHPANRRAEIKILN